MKVIGTIEARMGSTRLPGKTMMTIYDGMPLLECVARRFRLCKELSEVVVATTVDPKDDPIADWCSRNEVAFFRGSENDVLDRVVRAARARGADAIAQMGADSAYLDFELIDGLISMYRAGEYDYVCNDLKLTYPLGIYGHVVRMETLESLNLRTDLAARARTDVVRNIFEHPDKYRLLNVEAEREFAFPQLRFTIDYPEDMAQAREIYSILGGWKFTTRDLLSLYRGRPEVFEKTMGLAQHSAPHIGRN